MKYTPQITKNKMIFQLEKPIYGSFYAIWDKWLEIAKEKKLKLIVKFKEGIAIYQSVNDYLKGAKRLERFYKNPNEPMIFYGRDLFLDFQEQKKQKEKEEENQIPLIPFEIKLKIAEMLSKNKYPLTK